MGMPKSSAAVVSREVVVAAFHAFCEGEQEQLSEAADRLAADALEEMVELRTPLFDDWWIRNHYRYKTMREIDRRHARNVARLFIGQLQLGKIEIDA